VPKRRETGADTYTKKRAKPGEINIDFGKDNVLPELNGGDLEEFGKASKPLVLKKSVIERNLKNHPEVAKGDYNRILRQAPYNSDERFGGRQRHNPDYVNFVKYGEGRAALVLVELSDRKDNHEVVHLFEPNIGNITRMKRKK
jgi:hypothetical protein